MTPRTENILGALLIVILVSLGLAALGWVVPNYYVYFKTTVAQIETCPDNNPSEELKTHE